MLFARSLFGLAVIAVYALLNGPPALAQDRSADPYVVEETNPDGTRLRLDVSGKGAVLCAWELLRRAIAFAEACPGSATAIDPSVLAEGLSRIEEFTIENSTALVTQADVDAAKATDPASPKSCDDASAVFYRGFTSAGSEAFEAWIDDLLSFPREPVLAPCV